MAWGSLGNASKLRGDLCRGPRFLVSARCIKRVRGMNSTNVVFYRKRKTDFLAFARNAVEVGPKDVRELVSNTDVEHRVRLLTTLTGEFVV